MMTPRLSRRSLIPWSFAAAAVIASCNLRNPGVSPPDVALSYPVALTLSRETKPRFLYVANSNFDLRYNSGTAQAYDLEKLDVLLVKYACRTLDKNIALSDGGTRTVPDSTRYPMSSMLDAGSAPPDAGLLADGGVASGDAGTAADAGPMTLVDAGAPGLDAGTGDIILSSDYAATSEYGNKRGALCDGRDPEPYGRCCFARRTEEEAQLSGDRGLEDIHSSTVRIDSFATGIALAPDNQHLYVPVSSRSRLVYMSVGDGQIDCGTSERCTRGPGRGRDDEDPDEDFPGQPAALATGTLADLGLETARDGLTPETQFVATAHERGGFALHIEKDGAPVLEHVIRGLPTRPTSVVIDKRENRKLLYATFANEPFISRIALRIDDRPYAGEAAPRELLYETSRIVVSGLSSTRDLRDVALDPHNPSRLYALIRGTQEAVAFLEIDPRAPGASEARVVDAVRVGAGPNKLQHITIGDKSFLLVSCYDAKSIFIIDVQSRQLAAVVRNLSGPYAMAFDAERKLLHVSDFRASVLRVVDLAGLVDKTEPPPRIVATLGSPRFEGGLE